MKIHHVPYSKPEPDWNTIPYLEVGECNWGSENPDIHVCFQLVWNENGISYHAIAQEEHILARFDKPNSDVWKDSCMEFFFRPDEKDVRYFNLECNPNGAIYCGIGPNMPERIRIIAQEEKRFFNIKTNRIEGGWEMFLTIPIGLIRECFPGYEFLPGTIIYANFMKCGDDTVKPHYLSWNQYPEMEKHTFHDIRGFGKLILDE